MPPTPTACGSVRPAAVVNEAIRALAETARGRDWSTVERARYEQLLAEWAAAVRAETEPIRA